MVSLKHQCLVPFFSSCTCSHLVTSSAAMVMAIHCCTSLKPHSHLIYQLPHFNKDLDTQHLPPKSILPSTLHGPCSLLQVTHQPRQNIFLWNTFILSCWNCHPRLHHLQTRLLQQHPLWPAVHCPPKKYSIFRTQLPGCSPTPTPENTLVLSSIIFIVYPHSKASTSWSSSPTKLWTILPPHTWLIFIASSPLNASTVQGPTVSPPSLRPNTVPWGTEPSSPLPPPSGTVCPSTSGTPTDSPHLKDKSRIKKRCDLYPTQRFSRPLIQ